MTRSDLRPFAEAVDARLRGEQPDYKGITDELIGAKRMALALGDEWAEDEMSRLHQKVIEEWKRATDGSEE